MAETRFQFKNFITDGSGKPFYTRKEIQLPSEPARAIAYVCGLGQFNFYVNGQKVSDHVLDPAWTDYRKIVYYVKFDITDYLHEGTNVLAAEVGNGWYLADDAIGYFFHFPSFMPKNPNGYQPFDETLVFALHAEIELIGKTVSEIPVSGGISASDCSVYVQQCVSGEIPGEKAKPTRAASGEKMDPGDVLVVDADDTWMTAPHFIQHSNVYGSEEADGRKRIAGWNLEKDPGEGWNQIWSPAKYPVSEYDLNQVLAEGNGPFVRVIHTYEGRYLGTVQGRSIYDFGQNCSGMLSFDVKGRRGDVIHAFPAEKLTADGDVDQMAKNWLPIDVEEVYTIGESDAWETFSQTFTYVGGRFVAIDTAPENLRNVRLAAISSVGEPEKTTESCDSAGEPTRTEKVISTEGDSLEKEKICTCRKEPVSRIESRENTVGSDAGSFDCDDERYLQIYRMIERSVEANMLSVHTDCPTIERFAWQEENHLMAPSIMYMKHVKLHWEKFLADTRLAQLAGDDWFRDGEGGRYYPGDGLVPSQAPCYIPSVLPTPGMGDFYNVIGWGSSIILGTWWHYLFYGDVSIVRDNYEAGKKYLNFLKTLVNADGFINNGLGDWGNPDHQYAKENVETAFLYADADTMRKFAGILGKKDDEVSFAEYASAVKDNYNRKLLVLDPDSGRYCYRIYEKTGDDKADCPASDQWNPNDNAAEEKKPILETDSDHSAGQCASENVNNVNNANKEILRPIHMTQAAEAMPLFWGMVPQDKVKDVAGALRSVLEKDGCLRSGEVGQPYIIQAMNEYGMNDLLEKMILKPEHPSYYAFVLAGETTLGEYWEDNPRSHCHDMMGHIAEWYYNGIAGIRPLEPGFRKVLVKPYLPSSMNHMKCSYDSAAGRITVEMTRQKTGAGGTVDLKVTAADGIDVTVDRSRLPRQTI